MENKRYEFGGFAFGSKGQVQLTIQVLKESGYGYISEFSFELTAEERAELITHIVTIAEKDNN